MHTAFFLLLGASVARFLLRHPGEPRTPWIIALSLTLAALYVLGPAVGATSASTTPGPTPGPGPGAARPRRFLWLGLVVAVWVVLVVLAPSFAWCAVPLFYTALRTLPPRAAVVLVALLTVFVVAAQLKLSGTTGGGEPFDPNLLLAPPAVAALATAVFIHMERQATAQRTLIDDLIRTRRELAATERREGTLAERQRLSMEIHDTLAQHLSSQQMLLQAADRTWDTDPATARAHVRTATDITARGLAEARRLVHDLAPPELADGAGLPEALRALGAGPDIEVRFHLEGTPVRLPDRAESALLRIAQGALANVREHSGARTAALTLSFLGDQVVLDIADDGHGFAQDPGPENSTGSSGTGSDTGSSGTGPRHRSRTGNRGHGLPAMRARVRQLGGTLTVESTPGEGTVLSASIPLEPTP
ncbi:sensor histidine kinase [Streptomyces sp. ISL-66]|uniref:sensor histidine kinase n=1 Tax=Streptomyces sp. ISL-66 TaxID=2819186 RepID=UPI001BE9573D|nr:sensor histidine kinase [Streptomyces sp. ISL-66]MBT2467391.1 sensor histidine kinase [Streptomyces sp. ISL-66]